MALDTNCNVSKQHKTYGDDQYGSFMVKVLERESQREKEMELERKREILDQRNEKLNPLPCMVEGIYSLTKKTPRVGCGAGIQWVKTRPFFRGVTSKL